MHTRITSAGIRSLIWYFNKTMRIAIQGLHVDERSITRVKQLLSDGHRVVLMPIYKSFADAFIYIYIHNYFNLETPFLLGNYEDTPNIKFFTMWLKRSGYIYSRRSYN
jgi:glycerol-3-phosphate O-acyltransferase